MLHQMFITIHQQLICPVLFTRYLPSGPTDPASVRPIGVEVGGAGGEEGEATMVGEATRHEAGDEGTWDITLCDTREAGFY